MLIIVNKSDLLTDYQRSCWAKAFEAMNMKALFYSAHIEQEKIDAKAAALAALDFGADQEEEEEDIDEEELLAIVKGTWTLRIL